VSDSAQQGWPDLLNARQSSATCSEDLRTKWAVVGAGFSGLACARRLAELHPGERIIIIDAQHLGENASGKNSGFAVATTHFSAKYDPSQLSEYERVDRINQTGIELLRQVIKHNNIDCEWQDNGYHYTFADEFSRPEYDNFVDYLNKREISHRVLSREELKIELGTAWYQGGIKCNEGALMQPAKLVRGLADSLPSNVKLYENTPVLKLSSHGPYKLTLPNANIIADKVILACNYDNPAVSKTQRRIIGSTLSGSFTRVLTPEEIQSLGNEKTWGILSLHGGGATLRLSEEGRICIRNTAEYNNERLFNSSELMRRQSIHRRAFDNRFPQLARVPFEYSYSCIEGVSANKTNFFQNLKQNLYAIGGYNGSGISRGSAFGKAIAEYASGEQSPLINDCLGSPKARWLPPQPLLGIGAWFGVRKRFKGVGKDR